MMKPILIGALFVPVIFVANYANEQYAERRWMSEAMTAARPYGTVSDLKFPHEAEWPTPRPNPAIMCGYVDGRRFQYNLHEKTIAVENSPGAKCDSRFY